MHESTQLIDREQAESSGGGEQRRDRAKMKNKEKELMDMDNSVVIVGEGGERR